MTPRTLAIAGSLTAVLATGACGTGTGTSGSAALVPGSTAGSAAASATGRHPVAVSAAGSTSTHVEVPGGTPSPQPSPTGTPPTGIHSLVALGDSVPRGTGSDAVPYPEVLRRDLEPANPGVRLTNLGVDGATAADLADALGTDATTRSAVAGADVVLVTAGANDLVPTLDAYLSGGCDDDCTTTAVTSAAASLRAALTRISDLAPHARVLVTSYWNVFEDGDTARSDVGQKALDWSDEVTRAANAAFCAAATRAGAQCVDTYSLFKGDGTKNPTSLLAPDGDHPDQRGHDAIATALLAALEGA